MTRYEVRLELRPVEGRFAEVYRRRGMSIPAAHSGHAEAATWPYRPRTIHQAYAKWHGYFWLPCVLCGRSFGGHEITTTIPDPTEGPGFSIGICPVCTAERNGGTP